MYVLNSGHDTTCRLGEAVLLSNQASVPMSVSTKEQSSEYHGTSSVGYIMNIDTPGVPKVLVSYENNDSHLS
jgi:hypothetical protein